MKKRETEKSASPEPRTGDYHYGVYDDFMDANAKLSDETYVAPPDTVGWSGHGSYAPKGSIFFPYHEQWIDDSPTRTDLDNIFSDGKPSKENAFCVLRQNPNLDQVLTTRTFTVEVTVEQFHARVTSDAGGEAEWYMQHLTGYGISSGNGSVSEVIENPSRSSPATGAEGGFTKTVNIALPAMTVRPGCSALIVSRPFEKDGNRPNSDAFQPTARDVAQLMWDFAKMIVAKKFKDFAMDIVGALKNAIMNVTDVDDTMNPIITVLDHSAIARLHWYHGTGTFTIKRRCLGLNCTTYRLNGAPSSWSNYNYVGLYEANNDRAVEITYRIKIS